MPEDKRTKIGPTAPIRPVTGVAAAAASTTPAPVTPAPVTDPGTAALHTAPLVDPLIGQTLVGRYVVHKKLGEGGMGAVYLATHNLLDKQVALKVLHGEFVRKPDLVERFMQEAKSASRIRHENVIDISDFGTTPEGLVFFAMELLKGHDLHEEVARARLDGQRLPWLRSKRIFLQICSALSAAHALGIVHRDLKPENIYLVEFLGEPDFVKLLDFGIAKLTDVDGGERKLTRTGMLFGTPEYMSPEQARGENVDHRVDIYAMGCILYQLVTGRVPFEAENFMGVLSMHLTQPAPAIPPESFDAIGAPRELAAIIDKALAKDRNQRFASIDELARAVRRVSGDKPTGPVVVPPNAAAPADAAAMARAKTQWTGSLTVPQEPAPLPAKSKLPLIVGGAVLVIGAAAVAAFVVRGSSSGSIAPAGPSPSGPSLAAAPSPVAPAAAPVPSAPPAPAALAFDRSVIRLDSTPPGAEVKDLVSGTLIGKTPFTFTLPASHTPRQFALHHKDYLDSIVELVPEKDKIDYTAPLERGKAAPGALPVVHKAQPAVQKAEAVAPAAPSQPQPASVAPVEPPAPQPPPQLHEAPPPAPVPAAQPAHPADDDCGDPPCLKADPSRAGSAKSP